MSVTAFAIALVGFAFLVVAYFMLRSAERRLSDARDFYRQSADALAEARRINDNSLDLLNGGQR